VLAVNHQNLDVLHSLANRNDVRQVLEKLGLEGLAGDLEERHCTLGFRRAVEIYDCGVGGELAQLASVLFGQDVTHEECVAKRRDASRSASDKDLTHGRGQMGNGDGVFFHPFGEKLVRNCFSGGTNYLCTQEQRSEDVTLVEKT